LFMIGPVVLSLAMHPVVSYASWHTLHTESLGKYAGVHF